LISWYRGNPNWDVYVFGGYALLILMWTRGWPSVATALLHLILRQLTTLANEGYPEAVNNLLSQANTGGSKENYTNAPVRAKRDDLASR
jgi:hypothetical protein